MHVEIVGSIEDVEIIAVGGSIRDIVRLRKQFGLGRWRKLKGTATVKLENGHSRTGTRLTASVNEK